MAKWGSHGTCFLPLCKNSVMKQNNQNRDVKNVRSNPNASQSGGHRPENKDNLDSRKNEEPDFKGDDTTHNTKDKKSK